MWYTVNSIYRCVCLTDPLLPNANVAITLAKANKDTWLDAIINAYADYKDATSYRTKSYAKSYIH